MTQCDIGACTGEARWYDPLMESGYCDDCAEYLTANFEFDAGFEPL